MKIRASFARAFIYQLARYISCFEFRSSPPLIWCAQRQWTFFSIVEQLQLVQYLHKRQDRNSNNYHHPQYTFWLTSSRSKSSDLQAKLPKQFCLKNINLKKATKEMWGVFFLPWRRRESLIFISSGYIFFLNESLNRNVKGSWFCIAWLKELHCFSQMQVLYLYIKVSLLVR